MRLPPPLPCAIAFAVVLAVVGPGPRVTPDGARPDDRADDRVDDRIEGVVAGPLVRTAHGLGARVGDVWVWTDGDVRDSVPDGSAAEGRRGSGDVAPLVPGERVAVTGRLKTPRGLLDPGAPDRGDAIAARGAAWELAAVRVERLADEAGPIDLSWRWAADVQAAWAARAADASTEPGGAALRGIVTGDRGDVPDTLDQRWRAVGIYHVLSVSGLHLAVVAGLAFALLRRLAAASPWGGRIRPARWAAPPALVLAIAYTMITGAQLATLRALIVVAIALIAQMLDRPMRMVDAIGVAAIAVLAWRPADVRDPSFQLSFVAALVLAIGVTRARDDAPRAWRWLVRGAATSAWVTLATAPLTALHFHQIAPGGIVGNLVLTPLVELVALPLGLAGLVLHLRPLVVVAAWLVARVDDLAGLLARVVPVGTVGMSSGTIAALAVALALWLGSRERRTRLDALAWLALCATWALGRSPPPAGALRVTFLDVGQGDAALVELPDGATWLVDAGGNASARDLAAGSAPGRAIAGTLAAYGHAAIDLAIVSHPHPDHYLGLAALAPPIGELWTAAGDAAADAPARGPIPSFGDVARALAARGTRVVHPPLGVARREAGVELIVWAPRLAAADGAAPIEAVDPVRSVNDNSLVVELRFAGRTILFTGDIEAEAEDALAAAGLGHVDVVKVPHHGSPTSSTAALVDTARPALAVISCGVANLFHFPSPDVVARWHAAGARVERTDLAGAVIVTVERTGELRVDRFAADSP